jgi:cathepsin F
MKMIYLSMVLLLGVGLCYAIDSVTDDVKIFQHFQTFVNEHGKKYTTIEEFQERFQIFKQNYKRIEMHRMMSQNNIDDGDYELGISKFSDMTPSEFSKTFLNLEINHLQRLKASKTSNKINATFQNGTAPESWDWREKGVVSPVKSQRACGSCWAFSAVGNIESQYAIKTGKNTTFSEQQLVDCDEIDHGCNGGLMENAYQYLEKTGIMSSEDYAYKGSKGSCQFNQTKAVASVTGYHYAGTDDEEKIKQILFENGPFAIAINAMPLQFYMWGVFNPWWQWMCNPKTLNHGVLLVGYGMSGTKPYWIVKNSWGSHWGEKGYFRIIAGKGACGLNSYVITAEVKENTK